MPESKILKFGNDQLHYIKAGNGNDPLLFFHGFGQDHSIYVPIIKSLTARYSIYIFDLYFHGKSIWGQGEKPLTKNHWKETMNYFFQQEQILSFSVAGFSLGGKFALATFESFPEKCKKIFLLAPDGIDTSLWYSLATYPFAIRKFFKSLITHPNRFTALVRLLNRFKVVDQGLIRFADFQMSTEEKRSRVYHSWVVFRHLAFNLKKIARLMDDHHVDVVIVVGKYDNVVKPERIEKFAKMIKRCRFEVAPSGHAGFITRELLNKYLFS
jgi:pimeloyl-ACP methyl ester carboxylesterase